MISSSYTLLQLTHVVAGTSTTCLDGSSNCSSGLPAVSAGGTQLQEILAIVFGILAAISVLFVVIGGFRFVLSEGNPEGTSKARNTIIYAIIGLVISISAEGFVAFVLGRL